MKRVIIFFLTLSIFCRVFGADVKHEKLFNAHLINQKEFNKLVLSIWVNKLGYLCLENLKVFKGNTEIFNFLVDKSDLDQAVIECRLAQLHKNGLDQLILETDYMSDGNKLYIFDWDGKNVVNVFGDELVQLMDVKDLNDDGEKELIVYARYEGIHIYEFDKSIFRYVEKDEEYKKQLKKLNEPGSLSELFKTEKKYQFFDFDHPSLDVLK